jgi:hypothetical protein
MGSHDDGGARGSALSWALWKVLDKLTQRYFDSGGQLTEPDAGTSAIPAELLASVDQGRMLAATRDLTNEASIIVQALARIAAVRNGSVQQGHDALQPYLDRLGPEQLLVMAAVLVEMEKTTTA